MKTKIKQQKRDRRQKRIRAKVFGTSQAPRLSVFKSNKYINLQLVNDEQGVTLAASSTRDMKGKTESEKAFEAGKDIAGKALGKDITRIVFDRGGYIYTGNVARVADGAREGGLKF